MKTLSEFVHASPEEREAIGSEVVQKAIERQRRLTVEWEPVEWRIVGRDELREDTLIRLMRSPFYKGDKYAVRKRGLVLNKSGEWEYEPMPSSRDDEFYARCRFDSFKDAENALAAAASSAKEKNDG